MKHASLLASAVSFAQFKAAVVADSCTGNNPLLCENNGVCLNGDKLYVNLEMSAAYDFLIPSIRGMHCLCPNEVVQPGQSSYTGVRCEIPYAKCDEETMCFHGGYCATEQYNAEMYHCVCPLDENGAVWAGKHCEVPATNFCTDNMVWDVPGGRWFCSNGGICQNGVSNLAAKCKCLDGTFGVHCEYNEFQACSLQCLNKGVCKVGLKDFSLLQQYGVDIKTALNGQDFYGEHCVCPDGFSGPRCEISEVTRCGEGFCLNDAKCVQTMSLDGKTVYNEFCQCPTSKAISYTGKFCEYESSTFCPAPQGHNPEEYFCANGGECPNDYHQPCICQTGFGGAKCEFPDSAELKDECDLPCENGGTCFFGQNPIADETLKGLSNEGLDFLVDNKHCRCPAGFVGLRCEIKYEQCGNGKHFCLNGSGCVQDGDEFTCNCREASQGFSAYAGKYCENEATMFCEGAGQGSHSFCTNHGVCKGEVGKNEDHVGCICGPGWTGAYCEYESTVTGGIYSKAMIGFFGTIFGGLICFSLLKYLYRRSEGIQYQHPGISQDINMAPYPYADNHSFKAGPRTGLRGSPVRSGHSILPLESIEDDDDISMDAEYEFQDVKIV